MGRRPSNISRLQYLVTWEWGGQKARWQWCQGRHRGAETLIITHRWLENISGVSRGHDVSTRGLIMRCWRHGGAWHEAREYSGASADNPHHPSRSRGVFTHLSPVCDGGPGSLCGKSGGKRENDRDPLIWAEPVVRAERDTPHPTSLLYWYPGSTSKYPRAFSIIISPLASRFTLTNSPGPGQTNVLISFPNVMTE